MFYAGSVFDKDQILTAPPKESRAVLPQTERGSAFVIAEDKREIHKKVQVDRVDLSGPESV